MALPVNRLEEIRARLEAAERERPAAWSDIRLLLEEIARLRDGLREVADHRCRRSEDADCVRDIALFVLGEHALGGWRGGRPAGEVG